MDVLFLIEKQVQEINFSIFCYSLGLGTNKKKALDIRQNFRQLTF